MSAQEQLLGGWSAFKSLTPQDQAVFSQALEGFVGVKYQPEVVSTQVVAGTNYRFITQASLPGAPGSWHALVEIHQPLPGQGNPVITQIYRL